MTATHPAGLPHAELVEAWLRARSLSRGVPQPVAERGGWRVETASEKEIRRYVFAAPGDGLRAVAEAVTEPRIALKLCADENIMRACLPPRWTLLPGAFLMVCDTPAPGDVRLPGAYRLELSTRDAISAVRILTGTGALAASGYAAECAGAFVYDRIVTEEAHRRLGLGRAVMIALASTRRSQAAQEVLVATQAGRALYATLGWTVRAPYTTAIIPE